MSAEASKYAEALRASLINELFDGEAEGLAEEEEKIDNIYTVDDYIGSASDGLADVQQDLDRSPPCVSSMHACICLWERPMPAQVC